MSSRRSSTASGFTEDEINSLVIKLQRLLPNSGSRNRRPAKRLGNHQTIDKCKHFRGMKYQKTRINCDIFLVAASKVLEEICNYIRKLNRDADDLSERLSQLLAHASVDINAVDAEAIRSLLQQ